jgi:hypothetical protein
MASIKRLLPAAELDCTTTASGAPEGQRIDQRFAQDDLFRDGELLFIPDAFVRPGKVSMKRRALAQTFCNLSSVDLCYVAIQVDYGNHHGTGKVFVFAFSDYAQSITDPPRPQVLKQFQRFLPGVMTSDGLWSSWKGHRPLRSVPWRSSLTPWASASRSTDTSAFNRSISCSGIRAI